MNGSREPDYWASFLQVMKIMLSWETSVFKNWELLTGIGDADVKIDADWILGGTNDSEFGGKQRFGRMGSMKEEGKTANKTLKEGSGGKHDFAAAEASAMQDDFYQRDVDELDYNPNEQSDDDDVDDGSEEVLMDDGGGFAADIDDSGSDDDDGSWSGPSFIRVWKQFCNLCRYEGQHDC